MKNKKGVELATKAIIGICLAVAIILLTFSFFSEAFNTFLGTKDASIHNFHNLHNKIKEMLNNPMENIMTEQAFPFYISSGNADTQEWILIGIDSTWDDEKKVDGNEDESIPRPAQCPEDRACLCLYKQTGGKDYDEPPEMCKHFNQPNVYISGADGYERFYGHENKENNIKEDENWQARIKAREKYYTDNNLPLPESIVYTLTNMPEDSPYKHDDNQGKAGFNDGYSKNYIYDPERPYLTVSGDTDEGEDIFRGIDQFNFSAFFPVNYEYLILRHEQGSGCKKTKEDNIEVCDEHLDDGEQESRILYIEKYHDLENDKIHILIAERDGYINQRAISAERLKELQSEQQESEQQESEQQESEQQSEEDMGDSIGNLFSGAEELGFADFIYPLSDSESATRNGVYKCDKFNYPGYENYNPNLYPHRWKSVHRGLDLYPSVDNAKTLAIADGEIFKVSGFGVYQKIYNQDESNFFTVIYGHVNGDSSLIGTKVPQGTEIGTLQLTTSTGAHIHLEMYIDKYVGNAASSSKWKTDPYDECNENPDNPPEECGYGTSGVGPRQEDPFLIDPKKIYGDLCS